MEPTDLQKWHFQLVQKEYLMIVALVGVEHRLVPPLQIAVFLQKRWDNDAIGPIAQIMIPINLIDYQQTYGSLMHRFALHSPDYETAPN